MLSPADLAILALAVVPIAIWVAWSDLARMKIPNLAVIALALVWLGPGLVLVPFSSWAWGLGLGAILLVLGFVLNAAGLVGAGDAKFAAAMTPFFLGMDIRHVLGLAAACILGAFAAHRLMKAVPPFRRAVPDWQSWGERRKFPMGLALTGMLLISMAVRIAG